MRDLLLLGLAEKGGLLVLGGDCIIKLARAPQHVDPRKARDLKNKERCKIRSCRYQHRKSFY